jgi:hypothetical protein
MLWLIYWPLLLVAAAGVAIVVRKLRHKDDNPFIVKR